MPRLKLPSGNAGSARQPQKASMAWPSGIAACFISNIVWDPNCWMESRTITRLVFEKRPASFRDSEPWNWPKFLEKKLKTQKILRSQKGPTKPKNRANSTKEFSEQFEGVTGSFLCKTRVLGQIAPESSPERSAKSLSHSFFVVPFLSLKYWKAQENTFFRVLSGPFQYFGVFF